MKGIANITVKSADGRIKTRREEHNTITTAYKDKIAGQVANLKWGRGSLIPTSADDFKAVWLHGETLDDLCDIQTPLLVGGQDAKASGVSWQYAAPLTASVDEDTKTISNTWAWSIGEAATIKALSLHNKGVTSYLGFGSSQSYMPQKVVLLPNNKLWICAQYPSSSAVDWVVSQKVYDIEYEMSSFAMKPQGATARVGEPLYNGEFLTSAEASTASGAGASDNVLTILSADEETVLTVVSDENFASGTNTATRTFTLGQFENFAAGRCYIVVLPTSYADWVFAHFNGTSTLRVYQLPRTTTSGTISEVTTLTDASLLDCVIVGNMVIFNPGDGIKTVFSCKDSGTWRVDEAQITNGIITVSNEDDYCIRKYFNRNGDRSAYVLSGVGTTSNNRAANIYPSQNYYFFHNTILNLSSPLELVAGDALSITYKIVLDDSETA